MPLMRNLTLTTFEDVNIGFKDVEKELVMELIKSGGGDKLGVISIVGTGGIGKTTLAKRIFNNSDVREHFDCCAWVYVSEKFSIIDLLQSAVKQLIVLSKDEEKKLGEMTEEQLHTKLVIGLKGRRYLLVLDDVWKKEDWDILKNTLFVEVEDKPSRVLLTTRKEEVATHANPLIHRNLRFLDENESWDLFVNIVFQGKKKKMETKLSSKLKRIGKSIVKKCGGLPLAIVTLGGLLSTKEMTPTAWKTVHESANWHLTQGSNQCLESLALSYIDLPYYLKSCFLYFGIFPKDDEINASRIIQLWVAEGFIEQRDNEIMEDVGEEYLEELSQRSLIQVEKRRSDGGIQTCRIHDLLREMAISQVKKDRFLEVLGKNNLVSPIRPRRLAIHPNDNNTGASNASIISTLHQSDLNHLHSLLCFPGSLQKDIWKNLSGSVKLLRVLELRDTKIESIPRAIGHLIFLKYLGLKGTGIRKLPHSARYLRNLQTLNLWETLILGIPTVIWKLQKLRHLYVRHSNNENPTIIPKLLHCYPRSHPRIHDCLVDLQSLCLPAGSWIESGGLDKVINLRFLEIHGKLHLYKKALCDSITKLDTLRVLHLEDEDEDEYLPLVSFSQHVYLYDLSLEGKLEKLPDLVDFPPNLTELALINSKLKQENDPMATLEKLPKLRKLWLSSDAVTGAKLTCSAHGFANLQDLTLRSLFDLKDWIVKKEAMPKLKNLQIGLCEELKMLPDGLRHISTLQQLRLSFMSLEFKARVQKRGGEDWDKIQHIPSILNYW